MFIKRLFALAIVCVPVLSHAQFEARSLNGDGTTDAIYDAAHNLTWLRDANYYATLGLPANISNHGNVGEALPPGVLRYTNTASFADGLTLGGATDWRVPGRILPPGYADESCPLRCLQTTASIGGPSEYSFIQGVLGRFNNVAAGTYLTNSPDWNWELMVDLVGGHTGASDEVSLMSGHIMIVRNGDTGYAVNANGSVTPVPEPGTWAMLLLGLGALLAVMRRPVRAGPGLA